LAYTNGQTHARGTLAHEWTQSFVDTGVSEQDAWNTYKCPTERIEAGVDGGPCATTPSLTQFRNWIRNESLVTPRIAFVNATGAGILHGGRIRQASIEEVVGPHARVLSQARAIQQVYNRATGDSREGFLAAWSTLSANGDFPSSWVAVTSAEEIRAALPSAPSRHGHNAL
jgi:hypothetical protein